MIDYFKNKKVIVYGLGKSGKAAVNLLHRHKASVYVSDTAEISDIKPELIEFLDKTEIIELGVHRKEFFDLSDVAIISPSVSLPFLNKSLKKKVWPEIELAFYYAKKPVLAITGTNGKTTTTSLLDYVLNFLNIPSIACGNIGYAFSNAVSNSDVDFYTLEVSSFQLEYIRNFKPHIGVLLNCTPDHLNRHKTFENYLNAKLNIFKNQTSDDFAVINENLLKRFPEKFKNLNSKKLIFSITDSKHANMFIENNKIKFRLGSKVVTLGEARFENLPGRHNLENIFAVLLCMIALKADLKKVIEIIKTFKGVEHRLEKTGKINQVEFINDSKATNIDSAVKGIEAIQEYTDNIVLIAGGYDKKAEFKVLAEKIADCVNFVVLVGQTAEKIAATLKERGYKFYTFCNNLEEAVFKAYTKACPNGVVLFSPACASYDMYKNFEQRGRHFKLIVEKLRNSNGRSSKI